MSVINEINELAKDYLRVLNEGDLDGLQRIFLDECVLTYVEDDDVISHMTFSQYKEVVKSRQAPRDAGYAPYGSIVSIDVAGPRMAVIRLESAVQPRFFMDYLVLVKRGEQWLIASKVYYVMRVEADTPLASVPAL